MQSGPFKLSPATFHVKQPPYNCLLPLLSRFPFLPRELDVLIALQLPWLDYSFSMHDVRCSFPTANLMHASHAWSLQLKPTTSFSPPSMKSDLEGMVSLCNRHAHISLGLLSSLMSFPAHQDANTSPSCLLVQFATSSRQAVNIPSPLLLCGLLTLTKGKNLFSRSFKG